MSQDPQYQQPGYPQGYGPQAVRPTNTMAILALVFAFVFSPLGIVFGVIARRQIRQTGEGGQGLATAGLVLSIIFVVIGVLSIIAAFALLGVAATELHHSPPIHSY